MTNERESTGLSEFLQYLAKEHTDGSTLPSLKNLSKHLGVSIATLREQLEVARALGARHIFTERGPDAKMTLRRGFGVNPGERAVVVEDVVTTGGSTRDVVDVLRAAGASVLAAGSIVDRSGGRAGVGVSRAALVTLAVEAWPPEACPLCAEGKPVVKPGSRPV